MDLTYEWADDVIILKEGRVLKTGTVLDTLTKDETYVEAGLVMPILYKLFKYSDFKPRDVNAARDYLDNLVLKRRA